MNTPTEKHIEHYVRYPSELSRDEKAWIEEWIEKDDEVRLLTEWYREFYREIDSIKKQKKNPKSIPAVIHLTPFKNQSRYSNGFILAAQTPVSRRKKSGLKTVKTFVSEEHKTLIRILHDDEERQSKLFVISEFVDNEDIVLMDVSEERSFFVSRPGGAFVISDRTIPEEKIADWSACRLHLPLAKINVFKNPETGEVNIDSSGVDREKYEIDFELTKDQLLLTADFGDDPLPEKLILYSNEDSAFRAMDSGKCSIPLTDFKNTNSILFFYN